MAATGSQFEFTGAKASGTSGHGQDKSQVAYGTAGTDAQREERYKRIHNEVKSLAKLLDRHDGGGLTLQGRGQSNVSAFSARRAGNGKHGGWQDIYRDALRPNEDGPAAEYNNIFDGGRKSRILHGKSRQPRSTSRKPKGTTKVE